MRHAFRAAAVALALIAATFGTVLGLLFLRPLPTIDGTYRLLGLDQRAEIVRDRTGTPHVQAGDRHDLYFLQGYVTAQDRLAQMEAMRDAARPLALHQAADEVERAPRPLREALDAYAAGVTKMIDQSRATRTLPGELVLRGIDPTGWTAADVVAIASVYLEHVDRSSACAAAPVTASANGRPVFAADLYIEAPEPGWYEIGLESPAIRAVGVSLPGVPGIAAGHNGWVAWAVLPSIRPVSATAAATVGGLLDAMAQETAAAFAGSLAGTGIAACVADIYGREGAADRDRVAFLPQDDALVFGGTAPRAARLTDALKRSRSIDPEAMRMVLGRPAPPLPGARLIVDLAASGISRSALSQGISGERASPHFGDQAPLWEIGQVHALPLPRAAVGSGEGHLVFRPR